MCGTNVWEIVENVQVAPHSDHTHMAAYQHEIPYTLLGSTGVHLRSSFRKTWNLLNPQKW